MKLFISDTDFERYIYRITSFDRFIVGLKNHEIVLVSIDKWDDPFENFLFGREHTLKNGEIFSFDSIRGHIFAQCWTFNEESDFSWKVYSSNSSGIKLKARLSDFYNKVRSTLSNSNKLRVGKVKYLKLTEIKKKYEKDFSKHEFDIMELLSTQSLLIKRKIYSHENEVRFFYVTESDAEQNEYFKIKIDYNDIIESVSFDPRISLSEFEKKSKIIKDFGFKGDIFKSDIYDIPDLKIGLDCLLDN
jgi:hypothetical protein